MTTSELKLRKATPERLRALGLDERWLQEQIAKDPALLGLGDLHLIQREKVQPTGGRLDFPYLPLMTSQPRGIFQRNLIL